MRQGVKLDFIKDLIEKFAYEKPYAFYNENLYSKVYL